MTLCKLGFNGTKRLKIGTLRQFLVQLSNVEFIMNQSNGLGEHDRQVRRWFLSCIERLKFCRHFYVNIAN
jgi:hypothetical protein